MNSGFHLSLFLHEFYLFFSRYHYLFNDDVWRSSMLYTLLNNIDYSISRKRKKEKDKKQENPKKNKKRK